MSTTPGPQDPVPPILPSLAGEPRLEAHVREGLRVLRDSVEDPGLRRRMDDVVAGRASLRDLARHPDFAAMMDSRIDRAVAEYEAIPEEVREAELARARREAQTPPPDAAAPPGPGTW